MSRGRNRGPEAFHNYYRDLYGERWGALQTSLVMSGSSEALTDGLLQPYFLDPASIAAARALEARSGHRVLDLCAAPGGKSLVLAGDMHLGELEDVRRGEPTGSLVCNERSSARRARLHRVLEAHLNEHARERITVTGHDASRWGLYEPMAYDRVLADVPCSSEQHVLQSPTALAEWSASRTRRLAGGAYAIACAGYDALAAGGRLVYSTCALSPLENDGVIGKLLDRGEGTAECVTNRIDAPHPGAERTDFGWFILSDTTGGWGPIYFAAVERTA